MQGITTTLIIIVLIAQGLINYYSNKEYNKKFDELKKEIEELKLNKEG